MNEYQDNAINAYAVAKTNERAYVGVSGTPLKSLIAKLANPFLKDGEETFAPEHRNMNNGIETSYKTLMDEHADVIARSLSRIIRYAEAEINPIAREAIEDIDNKMKDRHGHGSRMMDISVVMVRPLPLLEDPEFIGFLSPYSEVFAETVDPNHVYALNKLISSTLTTESIEILTKSGIGVLDRKVTNVVNLVPDHVRRIVESGASGDSQHSIEANIAMFMFYRGILAMNTEFAADLMQDPLNKAVISKLKRNVGVKLNKQIRMVESDLRHGVIISRLHASYRHGETVSDSGLSKIHVNAVAYKAWLKNGGTPEMVMASSMNEHTPVSMEKALTENKDRLAKLYKSDVVKAMNTRAIAKPTIVRKCIRSAISMYIASMSENDDISGLHVRATEVIDANPYYNSMDLTTHVMKIICDVLVPDSDVLAYLTSLDNELKDRAESDTSVGECKNLAIIGLLTTHIAEMIIVKAG